MRQPCCRAGRAHYLARGIPLPILVTGVLNVYSYRSSSRSGMHAIPARRCLVAPGSCLHNSDHGQHLTVVEVMPPRRLEACATGSTCIPA
ncbi:MAG TPA: hypothetical protein DEF43_18695 [Chloroflexus aurantiacus]|nr:MAG: hypothetical protein D6716_09030 [Chloroflexota bacterium]HBW69134.1 hypothetical protein [Chloroflexus aurantiacus]